MERTIPNPERSEILDHVRNPHNALTCEYTNRTGARSIPGTVVCLSGLYDDAVAICGVDDDDPIGVMLSAGVEDGERCVVAVSGKAYVLLKDATAATRGYWVKTSDAAGRADASTSGPPGADPSHWQEIGHCAESKNSGTDVLCLVQLHFN